MPTKVFGEGAGYIGGDHKDTYLWGGAGARSYGSGTTLWSQNLTVGGITLLRFSLAGHIPTNAIVNTAVLTLTKQNAAGAPNAGNINTHDLITNWGITNINEGVSQNPAVLGQATHDNAYDHNGGGDVGWAAGAGVGYGVGDRQALETAVPWDVSDAAGTFYNISVPTMVQRWVKNDGANFGTTIECSINAPVVFHSSNAVAPASRPYLTVKWSRVFNSSLSMSSGLSM